jgi:aryl-alcohol dehydrogenase-like predicted oxidoreductase
MMRPLGRSGIEVKPLAFGGNVFGWTADAPTSFKLLDAFVDAGFNFIDTADAYSFWIPGNKGGESETVIGDWLSQRPGMRGKVVIGTKLGVEITPGKKGTSRAYMMEAVEGSLKRLKTDYIDLYWSHRDDDETPMEETLSSFAELIKAGKVRTIGASNFAAARLSQALKVSADNGLPRYEALQNEYNLYTRAAFEAELQGLCAREEIANVPFFGLASGFLTGKYRTEKDLEGSARAYRVKDMLNPRGLAILAALDEVAAAHATKPASVALAWLLAKGAIPIASATSLAQLAELTSFVDVKLTAAEVAKLDAASA